MLDLLIATATPIAVCSAVGVAAYALGRWSRSGRVAHLEDLLATAEMNLCSLRERVKNLHGELDAARSEARDHRSRASSFVGDLKTQSEGVERWLGALKDSTLEFATGKYGATAEPKKENAHPAGYGWRATVTLPDGKEADVTTNPKRENADA